MGLVIPLECEFFDNVGDTILELEGLGLQDGVVIGILIGVVGLLLDLQQVGFYRAALFLAL